MTSYLNMNALVGALVYSTLGLVVLSIGFLVFDRATPGNLWKEIVEEKNVALAIVVGSVTIAIAYIIGSAIHG